MTSFIHKSAEFEARLLMKTGEKDDAAFEQLYRIYKTLCFRIILKITKNRMISEEILQNVFIKIWDSAGGYNPEKGSVYSWITTITRNKAIDRIRSKEYKEWFKNTNSIDDHLNEFKGPGEPVLETMINSELAVRVTGALDLIPVEQREVIELSFFEGLSHTEIAEQLRLPLGTVKTRMRQGLLKLHKLLNDLSKGD